MGAFGPTISHAHLKNLGLWLWARLKMLTIFKMPSFPGFWKYPFNGFPTTFILKSRILEQLYSFFVNIFKTSYFRDHQNFKSWVFPIKFFFGGKVLDWLFPNSLNVEKGQGLILFYHHLLESNFRWDPYHLHLQMYGYISPFGPALCVKNDILYRSQAKTLFILLMIGFA